jgi:tRNA(Ile)-lysidine synthase
MPVRQAPIPAAIAAALSPYPDAPVVLAVSGGRDSMVLMHAAAKVAGERATVVYVDQGLHPHSAHWASEVGREAESLGLACLTLTVDARPTLGEGPEAAARAARYRALASVMRPGACLLTAHHRRDQAETVLLQLLRGAGPDGLSGMPRDAAFAGGRHLRPLLDLPAGGIHEYADLHQLRWVEDPSNADESLRRNFLRHQVLPRLQQRWPGADAAIARSASLCAESARRDRLIATDDLGDAVVAAALPLAALRGLEEDRARNALRAWLNRRGVRPPGRSRLTSFMDAALGAAPDRHPRMAWGEHQLARFQDALHLLPRLVAPDPDARWSWDGRDALDLGESIGRVWLEPGGAGLAPTLCEYTLELRIRQGGERIKPPGQRHRRTLKALLREAGCPPWLRDRLPLLYADGDLVAAGPWWTAAEHSVATGGIRLMWHLNDSLQVPDIKQLSTCFSQGSPGADD